MSEGCCLWSDVDKTNVKEARTGHNTRGAARKGYRERGCTEYRSGDRVCTVEEAAGAGRSGA